MHHKRWKGCHGTSDELENEYRHCALHPIFRKTKVQLIPCVAHVSGILMTFLYKTVGWKSLGLAGLTHRFARELTRQSCIANDACDNRLNTFPQSLEIPAKPSKDFRCRRARQLQSLADGQLIPCLKPGNMLTSRTMMSAGWMRMTMTKTGKATTDSSTRSGPFTLRIFSVLTGTLMVLW